MHVFNGPHPCNLADGTPLAIGQFVTVDFDAEHPHNAGLIRKGWLTPLDEEPEVIHVGDDPDNAVHVGDSAVTDVAKPAAVKAPKAAPTKEG